MNFGTVGNRHVFPLQVRRNVALPASEGDRTMTSAKDNDRNGLTRRSLLMAGAAAPALAASGPARAEAPTEITDHRQVRLQDTPHIRAYYDSAKG